MGVWTPNGWRIHKKRWGCAARTSIALSGDGRTAHFPGALRDPSLGRVTWGDDLHLEDDPFTDGGIYPCDPRIEYPIGRPRWAVSHTLLCFPVADHGLFTHEYTWDIDSGDLTTHFRQHVPLEQSTTDSATGLSVNVAHVPLSTTIEGNVRYAMPTSAVRGVWDNPHRTGRNYYAARTCRLLSMTNGVYAVVRECPIVQCLGLYATAPEDQADELFDRHSGVCRDPEQLSERLHIPSDAPKLGMLRFPLRPVESRVYQGRIGTLAALESVVDSTHLERLLERRGASFQPGGVGFAATQRFDGEQLAPGYVPAFDFDDNGQIDDADAEFLARNLGRRVRYNLYLDAYFGGNWLSTSCCLEPEHRPGTPLIADFEYGGGYDAETGMIRLLDTPGPGRPVWVEYFYDAPAEAGENNIRVHLYRESPKEA